MYQAVHIMKTLNVIEVIMAVTILVSSLVLVQSASATGQMTNTTS
jgi:hypothetical protein